ncbi:hypothetical protein CEXT_769661 [Caerostris extrusa]|uniref:Uncharacterized protein n=1 Tax=Caerostris extrusa TaxID=172846 RepID=A0AAV4S141_CAEEX|nr:hypothetical protein CEXT_769661 [Caerostris extrusa]
MDRTLHQKKTRKKGKKVRKEKYVFFLLVLSALPPDPAYVHSDIMSQPAANLSVCLRMYAAWIRKSVYWKSECYLARRIPRVINYWFLFSVPSSLKINKSLSLSGGGWR